LKKLKVHLKIFVFFCGFVLFCFVLWVFGNIILAACLLSVAGDRRRRLERRLLLISEQCPALSTDLRIELGSASRKRLGTLSCAKEEERRGSTLGCIRVTRLLLLLCAALALRRGFSGFGSLGRCSRGCVTCVQARNKRVNLRLLRNHQRMKGLNSHIGRGRGRGHLGRKEAFNECWKEGCRRGQKLAGGLQGSSIFSYGVSYEKIDVPHICLHSNRPHTQPFLFNTRKECPSFPSTFPPVLRSPRT